MMVEEVDPKVLRKRRTIAGAVIALLILLFQLIPYYYSKQQTALPQTPQSAQTTEESELARVVLDRLEVKGRAPKTGYKRSQFGDGWANVGGCDMRNIMLKRSLNDVVLTEGGCKVLSGVLLDPYTNKKVYFTRGETTSDDIQIDHVVALSDAWQKGAQALSMEEREQFANDPLNLLPVDGKTNQDKGDSDAASWLPPNKLFRCQYVARQIAVKFVYKLWVTEAEKAAIIRILNGCGDQVVPVETP